MTVAKKYSLAVILTSATLTIMAGSIIAPVLNLMRDGLGVAPSSVGLFRKTPVLLIIYGLMFFGNLLLYSIVIFLPQLLESFGISSTFRIGLFITAMTGSAGMTAFIYGKIRSRFSYRTIVTIAAALWTVAFSTLCQAADSRVVATAAALFGISQGLVLPTVMVWIGDVVPPDFRGRFSAYLGTAGFIGQFLSLLLFAPVFMLAGLKNVFLGGAGIGAVWFAILLWFRILAR